MSDWIKVEKSTPRKPEILILADLLKVTPDHAFGVCIRFWMWCDTHLAAGKIEKITPKMLDKVLEQKGFSQAMSEVGWVKFEGDFLAISKFDRHLAKNAKVRAEEQLRKKRQRETTEEVSRICPGKTGTKKGQKGGPEREGEREIDVFNTPLPPTPRPPEPEEPFHAPEESMEEIEPEADLTLLWMHNRRGPAGGESHAKVLDFFREQLRLGKSFSAIKAAIENPTRNRTEFLWQFSRRELEDTNRTKNFESRKDCEQVMAEMMSDPNDRRLMEIAFNGAAKN